MYKVRQGFISLPQSDYRTWCMHEILTLVTNKAHAFRLYAQQTAQSSSAE